MTGTSRPQDVAAEELVRAAFRGGPRILEFGEVRARRSLARRLLSDYVESPFPRRFIDGVLLFVAQVTRRRYPLFLHGAQLLAAGDTARELDSWLSLEDWDDPGVLVRAWLGRSDRLGLPTGNPREPGTRLLARSIALLAVSPAFAGDMFATLSEAVEPAVADGVLGLLELWTALRFRYAAMPRFPIESDPGIAPYMSQLEPVLRNRARVLRPVIVRAPALHESAEALAVPDDVSATLLENVPVGIIRLDSKGRVGYENPAMRALLGAPSDRPSPALGMRVLDLPNMRDVTREFDGLVTEGRPFDLFRVPFTSIFGKRIVVNVVGRPIHTEAGERRGSVVMVVDATREEQLEAQVVAMGRAEVLSSLVGRISHDLNNLLVGVRGHASILAGAIPSADPNHHAARRLDEAAQRLSAVVDGLLALAHREDHLSGSPVDVRGLLGDAVAVIRDLLPPHIELDAPTATESLPCRVGYAQLKHVLVNLAVTARDSIVGWGDGRPGRISIRLDRGPGAPFGTIILRMRDDGVGMTDGQREALFDPIASGHKDAVGRGLGLPVSHAIVAAYGGELVCASSLGAGTTLTMTLPACDPAPPPFDPHVPPREATLSTHVLVVEDNDIVRNLCIDVLESRHYRVTWVESGRAALRLIAAGGVDVALVDVGLPDITGIAVAAAVAEMGIALPIVLTSGNPPEALRRAEPGAPGVRFLRKPFQVSELLQAIDDVVRPI